MLLQNAVLEYAQPGRLLRVLWIDRMRALAYIYELGRQRSLPEPVALQSLVQDLQAGRARLVLADPFAPSRSTEAPPPGHAALQARALDAIHALHANLPALYRQRERAAMVRAYAASHGVSAATVMRWLRRWWERGQRPAALLPDYANSGARGRTRAINAGIKRGRPRKDAYTGANADEAMRAIFRTAAARYAATHAGFSRRAAYRQMLEDFFAGADANAVPSFGQFNYWIERDGAAAIAPPFAKAVRAAVRHGAAA